VADHFRRRSTETLHDESRAAVPSAPFEARDLLRRVFGDAEADATLRRSMHLALREADGESYADLAESETSSEAALRQRVSRFRRAMASRWLGAAVLLVLLGAGVVGHRLSVREPIGPDLDRATLAAIDAYQGAWIVRAWSGAEPLVVGRRIDVARGVVTISTPSGAGDITLTVQRVKVLGADAEEWTLSSLAVGKIVAIVEMKDHRTTLTFNDDRFRGTAVLERP
jgi:hypothetical protein